MVEPPITAREMQPVFRAAARIAWPALWLALATVLATNLFFFAVHAVQVLRYPFPLDYGEGPLLAQVNLLRSGASLQQLYGPFDAPPHLVVNYPPVYLLATLAVSFLTNNVLLAGRLVSLGSALACVGALFLLVQEPRTENREAKSRLRVSVLGSRFLLPFAFLALPIVREWAVLLRVDMLGVAFGLWALVALRIGVSGQGPGAGGRGFKIKVWLLIAVVLVTLSLFTKPSLVAAPLAALAGLLVFDWRQALVFIGLLALLSGATFAVMAVNSNFYQHVVVANANLWQGALAAQFWRQVLTAHWPLFLAGAISAGLAARQVFGQHGWAKWLLPVAYTLGGAATAIGVGKVGAYLNYFLELYAGLVWLVALELGVRGNAAKGRHAEEETRRRRKRRIVDCSLFFVLCSLFFRFFALLLLIAALVRYYPVWSESTTKLASVTEGANPPRLILGRRGVWQDLRRERQILAVMARTNEALVAEVRAAGGPILSDIPGIAAQAGQIGRLQAFEHSQIRQWNQQDLRIDLANGRVPLVVLDYLGNWLSPELIELITHRYAQEGSRGSYDLYRPLDPGVAHVLDLDWNGGLRLSAIYGTDRNYHGGETLVATLLWQADAGSTFDARQSTVVLALRNNANHVVATSTLRFAYGAIGTSEIPPEGLQHMQALQLPADLAPGIYTLSTSVETTGTPAALRDVATITIEAQTGNVLANGWLENGRNEFVPNPLFEGWQTLGGVARLGLPITPAVPFVGFTQQCFERGCLRLENDNVVQAPVGEWLAAGDIGANGALGQPKMSVAFLPFYQEHGGAPSLGAAVTNEFRSGERIVQYTQFARLERPLDGGPTSFGAIGKDVMRLPVGTPYRWP